jgi:hypothetical protein
MPASFLTRRREAVAQEEHQTAHSRDVRLGAFKRTNYRAIFVTT